MYMCFFFTAGDKSCKGKYLRKKLEEERFFRNTIYHFTDKQKLIKLSEDYIWQVESRSYSVATSAVKKHFKLWKAFQRELTVRAIFNDWLWETGTLTYNKRLFIDVNMYQCLIEDENETDKQTSNRPIWLTIDRSKPTNDRWQPLHESCSQYP